MNTIDLLLLHGPSGAGKSSVARAMANALRKNEITHTVIEMDDLAKIYPLNLLGIMYKNLAAIWPNYEAIGDIKIIIPTYMQRGEFEIIKQAAPAKRLTVCEVTASSSELHRRITQRESDEIVRNRLFDYIDGYSNNSTEAEFVDFRVVNQGKAIEEVAAEILEKQGWLS